MENLQSNMIKKCRANLVKEGLVKSVLCGMAIGFAGCFIVAFVTWFFEFKGLWLSLGLGLSIWAATAVLFYFFKFKPTNRDVMKRLDRAGLDERMITMYELQNDDSVMAARQRADATSAFTAAMKRSGGSLVKMRISAIIMSLALIAAPIGVGWLVTTGLSDYGVIPTGMELMRDGGSIGGMSRYYTVTFEVSKEGGGTLSSGNQMSRAGGSTKLEQKVKAGDSTDTVRAVAQSTEKGTYYFKMWVDEQGKEYYGSPYLSLKDVQSSKTFTAVFGLVDDEIDYDFPFYYNPNSDKKDKDSPNEPGDENNGEESPHPGDNPMGQPGPPSTPPSKDSDTVIDGETPYDEVYGDYHDEAMGDISDDKSGRPPELGDMLEGYFDIL